MLRKLMFFVLTVAAFLLTVLVLLLLASRFLFPKPENFRSTISTAGISNEPFADLYPEVERLASTEFKAVVRYNDKNLGIYYQKGELIRIDSPDGNYSYLYLAGLKKNYLLEHQKKLAKELFQKEKAPIYFNLYDLLAEYYGLKWKKIDGGWKSETKNFIYHAFFNGPQGLLNRLEKIDKENGSAVGKIEIRYQKVGSLPESLFYVPQGYSILSMYQNTY
jgi:hypothetical protein